MIEIKPPQILLAKKRIKAGAGFTINDDVVRNLANELGITVSEVTYEDGFKGAIDKVAKADMVLAILARDVPEGYRKGLIHDTPEGPVPVDTRTPYIEAEVDAGVAFVIGCAHALDVPTLIYTDPTYTKLPLVGYVIESSWGVCDLSGLRSRMQEFSRCYERYVRNAEKPNMREFSEALRTLYAATRKV